MWRKSWVWFHINLGTVAQDFLATWSQRHPWAAEKECWAVVWFQFICDAVTGLYFPSGCLERHSLKPCFLSFGKMGCIVLVVVDSFRSDHERSLSCPSPYLQLLWPLRRSNNSDEFAIREGLSSAVMLFLKPTQAGDVCAYLSNHSSRSWNRISLR